jgi:hypothetical protein
VPSDVGVNRRYLSNRVNPVVHSVPEALDAIARALAAPERFRFSPEMLRQFHEALSFEDDRLAATAMVDAIEQALGNAAPSGPPWRPTWKYRWHQPDKNVRGKLMPSLDLDQVLGHLLKFRELLQLRFDVVAEPCGTKLVHLSSRGLAPSVRWRRRLSGLLALGRNSAGRPDSARP